MLEIRRVEQEAVLKENENKQYEILSGDRVVAEYSNGNLTVIDEQHAPLFISDFRSWVSSRAVSENRGYTARSLKMASGLNSLLENYKTALAVNAVCVTDNYWVREAGSGLTYSQVCFDNYDGFFSRLSLGVDSNYYDYISEQPNPELTNIGNSDKAWIIDGDGTRWLYKKQPIKECYNEVLAAKLAEKIGIDAVRYELVYASEPDPNLGRYGIVRSMDFTQGKNVNLEHANLLLDHFGCGKDDVDENVQIFERYGCSKEYLNIKYFDILTSNPDRHEFNYGVLRDRDTGKVVGMAPNYDFNLAFYALRLPVDAFVQTAVNKGWSKPGLLTPRKINELREEMRSLEGFEGYENEQAYSMMEQNQDLVLSRIKDFSHDLSFEW